MKNNKINSVLFESSYKWVKEEYVINGLDMKWTMKNGDKIKIKEMETDHIVNCIKMIKRNNRYERYGSSKAWEEIFENVLLRRRIEIVNKIIKNIKK